MVVDHSKGEWSDILSLKNVGIHLHLLPTGKVLYWGRRSVPGSMVNDTLNEHFTHTYLFDPKTNESVRTKTEPLDVDEQQVNLFCAGHTFQPDGTLLVVGGHIQDAMGLEQACVYDPFKDTWTAKPEMNGGRWYPSAITLPDGRVLVASGSLRNKSNNLVSQIWQPSSSKWLTVQTPPKDIFALFPRFYLDPKGKIFMAGPLAQSKFLDLTLNSGAGIWSEDDPLLKRAMGQSEYAASVTYDIGKILYVGGGGGNSDPPTKFAEIIDLNDPKPQWKRTADIGTPRRHHFATMLPDGTVLVTGGTKGSKFNDTSPSMVVHTPELWNPSTGLWTELKPETHDRCYHGTALLMPDGRILSAGGGEYSPNDDGVPNPPKDTLTSAQWFSPPYLFKGDPPTVKNPPKEITYGQKFTVTISANDVIDKVSWIRIGSVTHATNMNQSFQFLKFTPSGTNLTIEGPTNRNATPPGHYMLFVLNKAGRPAEAPIIQLKPDATTASVPSSVMGLDSEDAEPEHVNVTISMRDEHVEKAMAKQERLPVTIGLTPVCPYGLGACWGGAYEALYNINDVDVVQPKPDQEDSIAWVYLGGDVVPDIDVWRTQLREIDSGTYTLRGIDMTVSGAVTASGGKLTLAGSSTRPDLVLAPFEAKSNVKWDRAKKEPKPITAEEAGAYDSLLKAVTGKSSGATVQVSGPLLKDEAGKYSLQVREYSAQSSMTMIS